MDVIDNKSDKELRNAIMREARKLMRADAMQLNVTTDHRGSLLRAARMSRRNDELEIATLFYATYFEHQVNGIIAHLCERKGLHQLTKQIVRDTSLVAKCTWVLELLGGKPLREIWRKRLISITDARNAYVHYKWVPDVDLRHEEKTQLSAKLAVAERIVGHLREYEDGAVHSSQGKRLRKLFRRR